MLLDLYPRHSPEFDGDDGGNSNGSRAGGCHRGEAFLTRRRRCQLCGWFEPDNSSSTPTEKTWPGFSASRHPPRNPILVVVTVTFLIFSQDSRGLPGDDMVLCMQALPSYYFCLASLGECSPTTLQVVIVLRLMMENEKFHRHSAPLHHHDMVVRVPAPLAPPLL